MGLKRGFTGTRRKGSVPRKCEYLRLSHDNISSKDSLRIAHTTPQWAWRVWSISWLFLVELQLKKKKEKASPDSLLPLVLPPSFCPFLPFLTLPFYCLPGQDLICEIMSLLSFCPHKLAVLISFLFFHPNCLSGKCDHRLCSLALFLLIYVCMYVCMHH